MSMIDLQRIRHPRASGSIVHMEAQLMMILSGSFIGFLPEQAALPYVRSKQMRAIKRDIYKFSSKHYVAFRTIDEKNRIINTFVDEIDLARRPARNGYSAAATDPAPRR